MIILLLGANIIQFITADQEANIIQFITADQVSNLCNSNLIRTNIIQFISVDQVLLILAFKNKLTNIAMQEFFSLKKTIIILLLNVIL